tara:strand:- start:155 stop:436 length:282 start_codon:yes stop_codon:yes gene_type:complete
MTVAEILSEKFSVLDGGRRRRKSRRKTRRKSRKSKTVRKSRKTKKKRGKKRKLNKYFALMLAAKKKGLKSFKYNGKTYVGKKHNRLGMIYKKK